MKTIKTASHTFEVVASVPDGFAVWNIPAIDDAGEFIPLFEPLHPNDPDCHSVNTATLKAVKMDTDAVARLSKAASRGVRTLRDAQRAAKSKRRGFISDRKRAAATAAMDDFAELWNR